MAVSSRSRQVVPPRRRHWRVVRRMSVVWLALALLAGRGEPALAQTNNLTVEKLLQGGWEVAGYVRAWENRTLILFKHKEHAFLVQCSVLIDVTRTPRVFTVCYEVR